jgi:hypothetical protein
MLTNAKLKVQGFKDDAVEVGACFLFKRSNMPAAVGIKVISKDNVEACLQLNQCQSPLLDGDSLSGAPIVVIPEAQIIPVLNPRFFGRDGGWPSNALYIAGKRHFLSFTIERQLCFVDLASGKLEDSLHGTFGWFTEWRLMYRGPNGFEEIDLGREDAPAARAA